MDQSNFPLLSAIPNFSGEASESVTSFIKNLCDVTNLQMLPEETKTILLRLHCKGKALEFIHEDPTAADEENFETLCNLLIKKFKKQLTFAETSQNFSNISQKPKQTVKELAEEVRRLATKFIPNNNENIEVGNLRKSLMLTKFVEALRADIKLEVTKFNPKTFEDAIEKAKDIERALEQTASINNITSSVSDNINLQILLKQQLESNKQIALLNEKLNKITENKTTCHICDNNHKTTLCPQFPSNASNPNSQPDNRQTQSPNPNHFSPNSNFPNQHSRGYYRNRNFRNRFHRHQFRPYNRRRNNLN